MFNDYILANLVDAANNSSILMACITGSKSYRKYSQPWQPPVYTSMRGWMAMNYLLCVLIPTLAGLVVYELLHMLHFM